MNDIFGDASKLRRLTKYDVPQIKHDCIKAYGYDWWKTVSLKELFEQYPLIRDDRNKRENLRINTLRFYGVKNPK
jgi:hypothetical protein